MKLFKVIAVVCLAVATIASPVPQPENDAVTDFLRNDQLPLSTKAKRRIYEESNDRELKQISLSSLIGDLEQSLFTSALSVNKVLTDKNVNVPEIKPSDDNLQYDVNQRHSLNKEETGNDESSTTEAANKVILQTTEKVPEGNGKPAHIVIDRIAIQPHTGGVAFIPIFELKRTVKDDNATKDREITKITISKTEITSLANLPAPLTVAAPATEETSSSTTTAITESFLTTESHTDSSTDSTTNTSIDSTTDSIIDSTTISDSSSSTTTSTITPLSSSSTSTESHIAEVSTTPKNIEQLKEAEEDLKEKVAEIEAEPIILSARV